MSKIGLSIQMNHFAKALIILVVVSSVGSIAQSPNAHFLPLQPHKVQWANAVIKNALQTKDTIQLAEGWYLYGKIYFASGNLLVAKTYFLKSLKLQEKSGSFLELSRLYVRLSEIESALFHYEESLSYAKKAIQTAKIVNSDKALLRAYGRMDEFFKIDWSQGKNLTNKPKPNYDSVLYYIRKSQSIAKRSKDPMELHAVLFKLGNEFFRRNDSKAIVYFEKAFSICSKTNDINEQTRTALSLASAYIRFNYPNKGEKLIRWAQKKQVSLPSNTSNVQQVSRYFEEAYIHYFTTIKDWSKAYEHAQKLYQLEKAQFLADREGAISRLSIEYETEKKEAELKAKQRELHLSQQSQQNQQRFVGILAVLLVGAFAASIAFYRISVKNQRLSESNATLVQEQNHRVKNNLQLVSSLLNLQLNRLTDDATKSILEETQLRIEVMSTLQRTLYSGQTLGEVQMHDFLNEIIKIGLQTFGYQHVQINTHIAHSLYLPIDHAMRIGLIVNELLTNACKYAFADHETPHWTLTCEQSNRTWTLRINDNGPGFIPPQPITRKSSFGMRLIQLQAEQLYATFNFEINNGSQFLMKFKV